MKGKRRRSRVSKSPKSPSQSQPMAPARAFTDEEEAFFAEGTLTFEPVKVETFADLDEGYQRRPSLISRVFARLSIG